MHYVMQAIPLLVAGLIVALILAPKLRGRITWKRPVARRRPAKVTPLRVSRDQMDDDLQDLIRRRR
jgi:hypothetical protein